MPKKLLLPSEYARFRGSFKKHDGGVCNRRVDVDEDVICAEVLVDSSMIADVSFGGREPNE